MSPPPLLAPPATPVSSPRYVLRISIAACKYGFNPLATIPSSPDYPANPIHPQTTRQFENNKSGVAGAAVKGIEKAGEMAQKVKEATGLGTGEAKGAAKEAAGEARGKAAELEGKAKGAFEEAKTKAKQ